MKALGEAALDLPWLSPCVSSLRTLAEVGATAAWAQVRCDPGMVLLKARAGGGLAGSARLNENVLEDVLRCLGGGASGFVDWNQPGVDIVYRAALRQAQLAAALAPMFHADPVRAWMAGLLAPLGWLAVCAVNPAAIATHLQTTHNAADLRAWQHEVWGLEHSALARRLARRWRLANWLSPCAGQLGLQVNVAARLGADPVCFQVVQLAVLLYQQHRPALGLAVGADLRELLGALGGDVAEVEEVTWQVLGSELPSQTWEPPAAQPLLTSLLKLALDHCRRADGDLIALLERDLDRLQQELERRAATDRECLQTLKLSALAEFAAGAGHEINNPLAVISGQAQYIQKQLQLLDGPAEEIDDIGAYLDNLRTTVSPSLQKIIGQTQRIHGILTGLMQFARPSTPRPQPVALPALVQQVAESLEGLAQERRVRLVAPPIDREHIVAADPTQLRTALSCLVRNAIEAAPADGWAGIRIGEPRRGSIEVIIEDSGPGLTPAVREHLFDPFFSGRSAGRGRGLGLPTAWRLARQQGGDVRFDGQPDGCTRFVLSIPYEANAAGRPADHGGRKTVSAA